MRLRNDRQLNEFYLSQNRHRTAGVGVFFLFRNYTTQTTMIGFNEIAGNVLLFFLVFGMSATVDIHCMLAQMKNAKAILMGVFLQFVIMPLCGFLVVKFMQLDRATGIIILVVTSSPGGSYSNW